MAGNNLRFLSPIKKLSGPPLPARANVQLWFDSDNVVLGVPPAVSSWVDRSTNNVPNGNVGSNNNLIDSAINGRPMVQFVGFEGYTISTPASPLFAFGQPITVAFVCRAMSTLVGGSDVRVVQLPGPGDEAFGIQLYNPDPLGEPLVYISTGDVDLGGVIETSAVITASTDGQHLNNFYCVVTFNGGDRTLASSYTVSINGLDQPTSVGAVAGVILNEAQTPAGPQVDIRYASLIIWNKELDITEKLELNDYYKELYDLGI